MKKAITLLLAASLAASMLACANDTKLPDKNTDSESTEMSGGGLTETVAPNDICDLPEDLKFPGETFTFAVYENSAVNNMMTSDEQNGDTMNDAMYLRKVHTEERFGCTIEQIVYDGNDITSAFRSSVMSGDSEFNVANVRCSDALIFWEENFIIPAYDIPYINIEKNYWNKSFNDSLSLYNQQYIAIGDMVTSTHDLTYALTFNKKVAEDNNLENMYDLVKDGKWTYDKMAEMMKSVNRDLNSDGNQDEEDVYGYVSHPKQVLPNFWIAAGELTIKKDENDVPQLNIGSERFFDVITRVFEMTYDDGSWYSNWNSKGDVDRDVPESSVRIFTSDRALFMDCSFFFIQTLRSMETDFGILPYPKFDENQERYYSRVSYYNAPCVPKSISEDRLEFTGALLEYFNYESSITVIPAYYDIALRAKGTRDEESLEMLDLIFESRVVDIGDTTLCGEIRDGAFNKMFVGNDRNLASKLPTFENIVNNFIKKIPDEYK